jgi:protein TonB
VALLQLEAVRKPLLEAVPLMVKLITPPEVKPPPREVVPPKPRPAAREPQREPPPRPIESPPLLVAESPAPSQVVAVPSPKPEPAPPAPAPPAPVVPPSFNAAYLQNPPPAYPTLSRRRGEKGTVLLRVYVSAQGTAEQVQVRTSSGHELLDQAALDAVRRWRFVPARQGDQPVAASVLVPIVFTLEG